MPWPTELRNNSLTYMMALIDAATKENNGVQESSEKTYNGLNAFNLDLSMPHAASVGTSIIGTIVTLLILYGIYALCRCCWRRHEEQKEERRRALMNAIQAQMGGGQPPHDHAALQAAHSAMQGAAHIPGPAGSMASAAASMLGSMGAHNPSAPAPPQGHGSNNYPILPGYAK